MIQRKRKCLALLVALLIALWGFPMAAMADTETLPNQDDNGKMWYQFGPYNTFNIKGYVGASLYQTTYGDGGYYSSLVEGENRYDFTNMQNGVEKVVGDNFGVTMKLSYVSSGYYVKVQYIVRNLTDVERTFSIGSCSDTQIGGNDYAPLEIVDGSTLVMRDGSTAQFNIVGKNAYGVTDVSTFWIGHYTGSYSNMFNQSSITTLSGTDSGLAYSWKDKVLGAGESMTLSVLFGVGPVNYAPAVAMLDTPDEIELSDDFSLAGSVTDAENSVGTKLYYVLDDGEPVLFHTFEGAPGAFNHTLDLPDTLDFLGAHEIIVFAEDSDGAISQSVVREFNVVMPPLTGIAMATFPTKLAYNAGEALDFDGLGIKLVYENGLTLPLEEFALSVPEGTVVHEGGRFPVQVTYTVGQVTYQTVFYYTVAGEDVSPDTGDDGVNSLMMLAAMMSLAGMVVLARRRTES